MIKIEFKPDDGYDDALDLVYVTKVRDSCILDWKFVPGDRVIPVENGRWSTDFKWSNNRQLWEIALPDYFRESPMSGSCIGVDPQNVQREAVNHPDHYNANPSGVEAIDVIEHMTFNVGNAVKYLWRADHKGKQIEDLKKARWYIDREIQRLEKEEHEHTGRGLKYDSFSDMMVRLYNEQTSDLILEQINTLREQKTKLLAELDFAETVEQARAVLKAAGVDLSLTDDNKSKKA